MTMRDGIYFGLNEDAYHAIERLSPSGIKRLRVSAATFWFDSWLNPNPKVLTEEQQRRLELAKVLGRAYHCARLEPDAFAERYVRMLDKADFEGVPGFIAGGTAYGEALGALGEAKKKAGESVADQAARLAAEFARRSDPVEGEGFPDGFTPGPIWDVELAKWEATKGERIAIPALNWDEIRVDMERLAAVPEIHDLLTGGFAEVSILWTCPDTGIPMKTRLDYLRADGWADFKTFSNSNDKHVQQTITDTFKWRRYHVQAVVQRAAVEMIRKGGLELATDPDMDQAIAQAALVEAIRNRADELRCDYVWQEKGGIPNLWARRLRFFQPSVTDEAIAQLEADGATEDRLASARKMQEISDAQPSPSLWAARAQREIAVAKRDFLTYSQVYPEGEPWLPFNPTGDLMDADFGKFWLEETD
jgi:hypothetical protein